MPRDPHQLHDSRPPRDPADDRRPTSVPSGITRWPYALLAYLFVALALVGVALPGIPTVPFLLLAAWAAARGSERVHDWLYEHPRFGDALRDWDENRAVSRGSKILAASLMTLSWVLMVWSVDSWWPPIALGLLFVAVGSYVLTRPEP